MSIGKQSIWESVKEDFAVFWASLKGWKPQACRPKVRSFSVQSRVQREEWADNLPHEVAFVSQGSNVELLDGDIE